MKRFGVMLDHFWQWQDIAQVRQPIFVLKIALFRVHRFFISGLSFRREGQKKELLNTSGRATGLCFYRPGFA